MTAAAKALWDAAPMRAGCPAWEQLGATTQGVWIERAEAKRRPRVDVHTPAGLMLAKAAHDTAGPRGIWFLLCGDLHSNAPVGEVEDCAIEFYTAFNAQFPGSF